MAETTCQKTEYTGTAVRNLGPFAQQNDALIETKI